MKFSPDEILFLPSTRCNLKCIHCAPPQTRAVLSKKAAFHFLLDCKKNRITKVGFTGGEVFLQTDFLYSVVRKARRLDFTFTHITTNGVWFTNKKQLNAVLSTLYQAGYDGSFFLSIDAFHCGSIQKAAVFIREACRIWQRPDIVSLAYVWGVREPETEQKIRALSRALGITMKYSLAKGSCCLTGSDPSTLVQLDLRSRSPFAQDSAQMENSIVPRALPVGLHYVIRTFKVPFSAARGKDWIRDPWKDSQWFKEDYCKGPGNVLFVLPDGTVKPCCGYGSHSEALNLGNIKADSVRTLLIRSKKNYFVRTIFSKGLGFLRKNLQRKGFFSPGKTTDHCVFCEYVLGR